MKFRIAHNAQGFTLVELMVVLIILALTIGLTVPRIGSGWKRMEDREFLQEIMQTLKRARLYAMNSGEVVTFRIRNAERLYGFEFPLDNGIPPNVDIYAEHLEQDPETGDHVMLFYPDGSLTGSDMEIVFDQQRAFRITIHPLLGTIEWFKGEPR